MPYPLTLSGHRLHGERDRIPSRIMNFLSVSPRALGIGRWDEAKTGLSPKNGALRQTLHFPDMNYHIFFPLFLVYSFLSPSVINCCKLPTERHYGTKSCVFFSFSFLFLFLFLFLLFILSKPERERGYGHYGHPELFQGFGRVKTKTGVGGKTPTQHMAFLLRDIRHGMLLRARW